MRLVVEETVGQVTEVEKLTTILQIADFDAGLRMMLEAEQSQTTQASGDITLTDSDKTIQFIDPNGANRNVNLPATSINNHGFVIVNSGSSYTLTVKTGSTTLGTVQADGGIGWFLSNGSEWIKAGGGSTSVVIEEQDGTPSITIGTLKVPNGTLSDAGGGIATLFPYNIAPEQACLMFPNFKVVSGTPTMTWSGNSSCFYGGQWLSASGYADGDAWEHKFLLKEGTYTIRTRGVKYTDRAKVDYYIDGVLVYSGQDWYAASVDYTATQTVTSITVTGTGEHTLKIKINGKGSGSAYRVGLTSIDIYPT